MPTVWMYLKRSLHCKSAPSDVHDPKSKRQLRAILTRKARRSGCSRSIANLKDVIHGSTRRLERPPSCSPRSIGSNEFLNPITHEVILSNSRCELKITGFGGFQEEPGGGGSTFVGTLRPGTPGPGGQPTMHYFNPAFRASTNQRREGFGFGGSAISGGGSAGGRGGGSKGTSAVACHKCGEEFGKWEALEAHHLSKHAGKKIMLLF